MNKNAALLASAAFLATSGLASAFAQTGAQPAPIVQSLRDPEQIYSGWRASSLIGESVESAGKKIGEVRDILVGYDGNVAAVVVFGGTRRGLPDTFCGRHGPQWISRRGRRGSRSSRPTKTDPDTVCLSLATRLCRGNSAPVTLLAITFAYKVDMAMASSPTSSSARQETRSLF